MKILILSCNTGEGHNSAGKAVMEAALLRGHEVEFMDLMLLGGKTVSHMVGGAYISIVRHIPAFFSLLYKVGGLISSSGSHRSIMRTRCLQADWIVILKNILLILF